MTISGIPNYDMQGIHVILNGSFKIGGVQGVNLGEGLESGNMVDQGGQAGPMGETRGRFKGDGSYSLKLVAYWGDLLSKQLANTAQLVYGYLPQDGIHSIENNLMVIYTLDGAPNFVVEFIGVRFSGPTLSGADSADSKDPMLAEFKFTCLNRIVNGVPAWMEAPL